MKKNWLIAATFLLSIFCTGFCIYLCLEIKQLNAFVETKDGINVAQDVAYIKDFLDRNVKINVMILSGLVTIMAFFFGIIGYGYVFDKISTLKKQIGVISSGVQSFKTSIKTSIAGQESKINKWETHNEKNLNILKSELLSENANLNLMSGNLHKATNKHYISSAFYLNAIKGYLEASSLVPNNEHYEKGIITMEQLLSMLSQLKLGERYTNVFKIIDKNDGYGFKLDFDDYVSKITKLTYTEEAAQLITQIGHRFYELTKEKK